MSQAATEREGVETPANGSVVVAAAGVTRRYGQGDTAVEALRGVSLEVEQGQLSAVMGPSGSGNPRAAAIADRILFLDDGFIVKELGRVEVHDVVTVMEELGR